jgi:probable F420-dependent oxidoreductase
MVDRAALGRFGIWSSGLRYGDREANLAAVATLESAGFATLWVPGGRGGDVFGDVERLLDATQGMHVATGILNVWAHAADETAAGTHRLRQRYGDRFLLGLGVSHGPLVESLGHDYTAPLAHMRGYLDELAAAEHPVPPAGMVLAALGPKMLDLAAQRTAGAHPYFVPPDHTAFARERLGPGPLLAVEQAVVFETDPVVARAIARKHVENYLGLPNYTGNLLRLGLVGEADLAGGGSDRLVDLVVAWGDDAAITNRLQEHLDAGADHVCVQVLPAQGGLPAREWQRLAQLVG